MVVTTLCGTVDEDGNGKDTPDASFADCGKIDNPTWFSFDPENHNILYLSQDNGGAANKKPLRILDLAKEHISTMAISSYGIDRLHTISWTKIKIWLYPPLKEEQRLQVTSYSSVKKMEVWM